MANDALRLPPSIPSRGNALSRGVGRALLKISGWKFEGVFPNYAKIVVIVAPHTSNWDFPLGIAAIFALGLKLSFLGKHSLFIGPLDPVMRWLGGIPVKRVVNEDTVAEGVDAFSKSDRFVFALAPEGTRKYVENWRSGFYHVAVGAGAPIIPIGFDYSTKTIRILPAFFPTGDMRSDIIKLRKQFRAEWALKPVNFHELPKDVN